MIGHVLKLSNKFREQFGALANNLEQILGDLAGKRQKEICVLSQFLGERDDGPFGRRRLLAPLDFAQVGRLDADGRGQFANREPRILGSALLAALSQIVAETVHVCVVYTTHYTNSMASFEERLF
jgi:hypothetical protein